MRAAALLLDGIFLAVFELLIAGFFVISDRGAVVLSVGIVYYVLGSASGATLGKRFLGLRIVDTDGRSPGLMRGFARTVVEGVSCLALFLGYFWMLWDEQKQTWHDKAAGTFVVRI